MPLNCINYSSVIKSTLLITYFVSLFQPIDFMCKTVCSGQYTIFYLCVFYQCLSNSLTQFGYSLTDCLEIWKRYCRWVYESPVAQNCNVTTIVSWTRIAAWNLVSLSTIFRLTKFISSSRSVGAFRVHVLYHPQNSWHFKSVTRLVPLYTDLFLDNVMHRYEGCASYLLRHFPTRSSEHWWITASSPFARMLTVLT